MIVTALRIVVLGLGAYLIIHGHLTIGGLVAFVSLMGEVISPVTMLTNIGQQIQAATGALVRINEVLEAVPEVKDTDGATVLPPLNREIRLVDVGFSYTGERKTLEGVTARIAAGTKVAFVGSTGAGKSSVLQLVMRFYDVDEGSVEFDGHDLRNVTLASLRNQLGVVFQETFLFDATIAENIELGRPGATEAEVEAAARLAELHDFVVTLPRGYHTLVGERGGRLSGGQRQRLAIAPRVAARPGGAGARRGDVRSRPAHGAHDRGHSRQGGPRAHDDRRHPPPHLGRGLRPDLRHGRGPPGRARDARRAARGRRHLRRASGTNRSAVTSRRSRRSTRAPRSRACRCSPRSRPTSSTWSRSGCARSSSWPARRLAEGGGRLLLVRQGRAKTLVPGLTGQLVPVADLGPGDAFGLTALLGEPTGAVLQAVEALRLLVLDDEAITGLAALFAPVAAALDGRRAGESAPEGGTRLSRMTIAPMVAPAPPPPVVLDPAEVRRATGAFLSVRP